MFVSAFMLSVLPDCKTGFVTEALEALTFLAPPIGSHSEEHP